MSDLYFTCDWLIRPAVNYVRLVGVARELGCELAIAAANIVTPEKFVLVRFALHVPSQAVFDEFVSKVGEPTGLTDWQPVSAGDFEQAQTLDLHLLDTEFITKWMDGMHAYGLHNQQLLEQQQGE